MVRTVQLRERAARTPGFRDDVTARSAAEDVPPPFGAAGGLAAPGTLEELLTPQAVICHCLQVRLETVQRCIARGCTTRTALVRETGVTSVCGGCTPRVEALLGGAGGFPAQLVEAREINPAVRSFRFAPLDPVRDPLRPALPGQHVVVSALIDGQWVSRPYTLTSPAGEREHYEITVKLEPGGRLSRWLFDQHHAEFRPIHLTYPQGRFVVDLERPEPVVFLVAGIGVTPALAAARTLAGRGRGAPVCIDYSAREADDLAFRDELESVAASCDWLRVRFRATGAGDRLGEADVQAYHRWHRRARFYVCGPERYQEAVRRHLAAAGVEEGRIHVEVFTSASRRSDAPRLAPRRLRDSSILATGVLLLLAYLAQGALDWRWSWLAELQEVESYRRWSGSALLAFIAAQWVLPVLRLRGRLRAAGAAYPWHRWLGALSPVLFYAHAMRPGYGYLAALTLVYLTNVGVGLADKTLVRDPAQRERYGRAWLVPHVALACLTVGLALFHLFVVLAYR